MTQDNRPETGTDPSSEKEAATKTERQDGERGLNNPVQVEQDNRIDKARAEARTAGGGPDAPEGGLNQDG